jgi:hypothetical protein
VSIAVQLEDMERQWRWLAMCSGTVMPGHRRLGRRWPRGHFGRNWLVRVAKEVRGSEVNELTRLPLPKMA